MPRASRRFASSAPISDARTMSSSPARSATTEMISSGRLPNVAFSSPPMAGPVRAARCSVLWTMSTASGTIATAAMKKTNGAPAPAFSRTTVSGMAISSQWIENRTWR